MYGELHYLNSFQHINSETKKGTGKVVPGAVQGQGRYSCVHS